MTATATNPATPEALHPASLGSSHRMSLVEETSAAPLLLTVEQAAKRLGIGRTTFYALITAGEIESVPLGRLRRIPAECLTEYIDRLRATARDGRQAA